MEYIVSGFFSHNEFMILLIKFTGKNTFYSVGFYIKRSLKNRGLFVDYNFFLLIVNIYGSTGTYL